MNFIKNRKFFINAILATLILFSLVIFYKSFYCNNYLTILGIINHADGIGRQAIDLSSLIKKEVQFNIKSPKTDTNSWKKKIKTFLNNQKLGYVIINEIPFSSDGANVDKYFSMFEEDSFLTNINKLPREKQIFITYSMLEVDKLPLSWVYMINKYWDMVVIPDKNLLEIFVNSGITKPIFVLPLGTNLESHLAAPLKTQSNKLFTFANFASFEERKNILKLVQAYNLAFKNNNQVRLYLSPRVSYGNSLNSILSYIAENDVKGVETDLGVKSNNFYNFMFDHIDCYVSPSKAEGFSVIPRESMARGIPTIVSDAFAQKTIADSNLVKVVHANKYVPAYYEHDKKVLNNHIDIEVSDLANAMLDVYNNYQKYLDRAPEARAWAEKGQYKHLKNLYLNMVKPKKIILGNHNEITEDYLMTNSQELYNKWKYLESIGLLQ